MWITVEIDNKEIPLNDFLDKLPSSGWMMDLIEEIQKIDDNWETIDIKAVKKPKDYSRDDDVVFRQV